MTTYTKESKSTTSYYPQRLLGIRGSNYGYALYGFACYGISDITSFTKESKPTTTYTKETKS